MANSLLDFVMSLVRDPDAAARFAENPDQTLFDANLANVTSADVHNLIPVVTESLGADNVWASGAATAAFDAFDDQVPVQAIDDVHTVITGYVDSPDQVVHDGLDTLGDSSVPGVVDTDAGSLLFDQPVIDDLPVIDVADHADLSDGIIEVADMDSDPSGYDIF
jgi:hypothetical protein